MLYLGRRYIGLYFGLDGLTRLASYRGGAGLLVLPFRLLTIRLVPVLDHGLGAYAPLGAFIFELCGVGGHDELQLGRSLSSSLSCGTPRPSLRWRL